MEDRGENALNLIIIGCHGCSHIPFNPVLQLKLPWIELSGSSWNTIHNCAGERERIDYPRLMIAFLRGIERRFKRKQSLCIIPPRRIKSFLRGRISPSTEPNLVDITTLIWRGNSPLTLWSGAKSSYTAVRPELEDIPPVATSVIFPGKK